MNEILPGLFHWTAHNSHIESDVDSYYVSGTDPAVLIDPMLPDEGMNWFQGHSVPAHILMTNRLHDRGIETYVEHYGSEVWCHRSGLHEFTDWSVDVKGFDHGDELPGGILALEIGVLCPEETALLIPIAEGILAIGDDFIRLNGDGDIGFVPDFLMGDDPDSVKRGLRDVYKSHLDQPFDHLIFAHGRPIVGDAKSLLRSFLDSV